MISWKTLAVGSILMTATQAVAQDTASQSSGNNLEPDLQFDQPIEDAPEAQQSSQAGLAPFEFFGLTTDRVYDEKIKWAGRSCRVRASKAEDDCSYLWGAKIGNATTTALLGKFKNGKMVRVLGNAMVSQFGDLADAFTAKYGEPSNIEESVVQNRMGAEFNQITMYWQFSDGVLQLDYRGSTIDKSFFSFISNELLDVPKEAPPINF